MSARQLLRHRATIERDATASTNPWGGKDKADWQDHLTELPCRTWVRTAGAGDEQVRGDKTAVVEQRRMIVPLGTDVTERDRVASVTDRLGVELHDGPMRIQDVGRREDHMELILERIDR